MIQKSSIQGWTPLLLSCFCVIIVIFIKSASSNPVVEGVDKRAGHNIMRFGRQAGHNILRFGRAPGHNIMRFGKREESSNSPGSSFDSSAPQDYESAYGVGYESNPMLASYYGSTLDYPIGKSAYSLVNPAMLLPYQSKKNPQMDNVFMRFG